MFTGKSTLLAAIGNREFPIPKHVDIFLLKREMPPSDKTAIQCVMEVEEERIKLEKEAEILATVANDGRCNNFVSVHDFARSALKLVLLNSHKTYHI